MLRRWNGEENAICSFLCAYADQRVLTIATRGREAIDFNPLAPLSSRQMLLPAGLKGNAKRASRQRSKRDIKQGGPESWGGSLSGRSQLPVQTVEPGAEMQPNLAVCTDANSTVFSRIPQLTDGISGTVQCHPHHRVWHRESDKAAVLSWSRRSPS